MTRRKDWSDEDAVYFRLFTARFLKGTRGLSDAEFKVYTLLLIRMYEKEGPLPRNDELLATFCAPMRVATFTKALDRLIRIEKIDVLDDGTLFNAVASREITWRTGVREAGRKGWKKSAANRAAMKSSSAPDEIENVSENFLAVKTEEKQGEPSSTLAIGLNQKEEEEEEEYIGGGGGARASEPDFHDRILLAAKVDPTKDVAAKWHSSEALWAVERWLTDLALTGDQIIHEIDSVMRGRTGPPGSLAYFNPAMERAAGRKLAAPLTPSLQPEGVSHGRPTARASRSTEAVDAFIAGARRLPGEAR